MQHLALQGWLPSSRRHFGHPPNTETLSKILLSDHDILFVKSSTGIAITGRVFKCSGTKQLSCWLVIAIQGSGVISLNRWYEKKNTRTPFVAGQAPVNLCKVWHLWKSNLLFILRSAPCRKDPVDGVENPTKTSHYDQCSNTSLPWHKGWSACRRLLSCLCLSS